MGLIAKKKWVFLLLAAGLSSSVAFGVGGCGGDNGASSGDGGGSNVTGGTNCTSAETCKKVTIGTQVWMAENLNIKTADSWCYANSGDNCRKYGRLYTWGAAMLVCPSGWHLPSRTEWQVLVDFAGGSWTAGTGTKLKSTTGWNYKNYNGNGTDDYGFSALPGGDRYFEGSYVMDVNVGISGRWWTATESDGSDGYAAYYRRMSCDSEYVHEDEAEQESRGLSVRCVMD